MINYTGSARRPDVRFSTIFCTFLPRAPPPRPRRRPYNIIIIIISPPPHSLYYFVRYPAVTIVARARRVPSLRSLFIRISLTHISPRGRPSAPFYKLRREITSPACTPENYAGSFAFYFVPRSVCQSCGRSSKTTRGDRRFSLYRRFPIEICTRVADPVWFSMNRANETF